MTSWLKSSTDLHWNGPKVHSDRELQFPHVMISPPLAILFRSLIEQHRIHDHTSVVDVTVSAVDIWGPNVIGKLILGDSLSILGDPLLIFDVLLFILVTNWIFCVSNCWFGVTRCNFFWPVVLISCDLLSIFGDPINFINFGWSIVNLWWSVVDFGWHFKEKLEGKIQWKLDGKAQLIPDSFCHYCTTRQNPVICNPY